jgi:SPP1 gp7 family putative phage head morphogenesis protein
VNENVLRWVLGSGGGFGEGYGDAIAEILSQSSERQIRTQIAEWIRNDLTLDNLITNLGRQTFGMRRAEMVVTTEITRAYAEGNRAAWRESRVIREMRWRTSADERVCEICGPLEGQTTGIDGEFEGRTFPPAHPRCRCWITPVVGES